MKKERIDEIENKLRKCDYKLTPQRIATLDVLLENESNHLSPEEIHQLVKQKQPDTGIATVYRTLQLFDELDIAHKLNFGDGCYRYEITRESGHQHHHLICLKCGKVREFDDDLLEQLEKDVEKKSNFKVVDHRLKFFGYCKDCKQKDDLS
jgi:Fur family ferric uptake transcriptional regulator